MAHIEIDNLKKLRNVAEGVDFNESCILANQTRSPRTGSTSSLTSKSGQLVPADLSGPQDVQSLQGNSYVMTITDDYTRRVIIYFLKHRSEAVIYMKDFMSRAAAEGNPVLSVHVDNGRKYPGRELLTYLADQGVLNEPSVPYSTGSMVWQNEP